MESKNFLLRQQGMLFERRFRLMMLEPTGDYSSPFTLLLFMEVFVLCRLESWVLSAPLVLVSPLVLQTFGSRGCW